jgi:excisionase family DNA binding protein
MSATVTQNTSGNTIQRGALKLKPAAQYLSFSTITVRRLVKSGQLRANRSTRHLLFSIKELDRFLEGRAE